MGGGSTAAQVAVASVAKASGASRSKPKVKKK
jgi:hypothetical protein